MLGTREDSYISTPLRSCAAISEGIGACLLRELPQRNAKGLSCERLANSAGVGAHLVWMQRDGVVQACQGAADDAGEQWLCCTVH